ncbi:MAG: ABC transporter substrate-binding protein [Chloroflexota bacterium]|nr:MAG: ABC transporter substrate-binding protein [Chloroflexota bacterium]
MRTYKLITIVLLLAFLLGACQAQPVVTTEPQQAPTTAPTQKPTDIPPTEKPAEPTKAPEPEPTAKPTEPPPAPVEELPEGVKAILTVNLREGLKWSDGTDMTTKDLLGTYQIYWAQNNAVWTHLKDIVIVDDHTIDFQMSNPSPRALRLILRANLPAPYSVYGEFMDKAAELRAGGLAKDSDEVKAFLDELYAFKPETVVAYGPYILDPASVTEAQLELVRNPTGYNADQIDFDKVLVYYGETAAAIPLVLSNEVDYATHGFTPSDVEAIRSIPNMTIIGGPTGTGPGLWFNNAVYPLDKTEVRQAFAYIIDRSEVAQVAMGEAGVAIQYEAGFTDTAVKSWLTEETIAKLNRYEMDWAKAEELLTSVGFSKGADGFWLDDQGTLIDIELSVPSDFADWLGAAESAAQQLNAFGIKTTVRGYPSAERATTQTEGKYDILVDLAIYYNPPHPHTSFNYYLNTPRNAPEATDNLPGFGWPWKQTMADGTEVYVPDLLTAASSGLDFELQKPAINQLALLVNEQLPVLAFFERYSTDPVNLETRVTGWLPAGDLIYLNGQGADNYMAIQLLNGTLKVSETGDGSIHTVWPYVQPPNYDLNQFTTTSLLANVGTLSYPTMFPPLFWYIWADGEYVPVIAESYSLR